jgi:formyl-CoA transferase
VGCWFAEHTAEDAQRILDEAGVPVSPIYSIADIFRDPQYRARQDILEVQDPEMGAVPMPAILPRFSRTPGTIRSTGPRLGEHNGAIYGGLLGLSEADIEQLHIDGVV